MEEATTNTSYCRAEYDADGRLSVLEKMLDGKMFFRHEYLYYGNGRIREARVVNADKQTTVHRFDDAGQLIAEH